MLSPEGEVIWLKHVNAEHLGLQGGIPENHYPRLHLRKTWVLRTILPFIYIPEKHGWETGGFSQPSSKTHRAAARPMVR